MLRGLAAEMPEDEWREGKRDGITIPLVITERLFIGVLHHSFMWYTYFTDGED